MTKPNEKLVEFPRQSARDILTDVLRDGAQQMLATAIEAEVDDYLAGRASTVDAAGRRYVVRNGHLPPRAIQTPLGDVQVQQPRVRDRRPTDERETFRSAILPPYLRKTPSWEALYPWLYLKGISTGDFGEALQALLGPEARGLSATTITRLKAVWEQEYQDWSKRSLAHRSYAYVWADGVYFNVRLEDTDNKRQCMLVLMGATWDGTKELIAITDGYRESEQSWRELLLDVRHRGLTIDPELAIGDGGLGFWGAVRKVFPQTREQHCWVHKTFALRETLQFAGSHLLTSLVSFNIGVELGQLLVLVLLVPALSLVFRFVVAERVGTILLSALVAHTGWHWMSERAGQLSQYRFQARMPAFDLALLADAMRWSMLVVIIAALVWLMTVVFPQPAPPSTDGNGVARAKD